MDFPGALVEKNPPTNAGTVRDLGLISGLGRSPGGGHGNPLQNSCLENLIATGHRVAELDTTEIPWHYAQMMKDTSGRRWLYCLPQRTDISQVKDDGALFLWKTQAAGVSEILPESRI